MAEGAGSFSGAARFLFWVRWRLGRLFGWDRPEAGVGRPVASLRDPVARGPPGGSAPDLQSLPLRSVYLTDREWVTEMANRTVHTAMHIGWVADGSGGHHGQLAVLLKPNGRFGRIYMALIRPFRHLVVDPALVRLVGGSWRASTPGCRWDGMTRSRARGPQQGSPASGTYRAPGRFHPA
jgi:hypothetical protein